ncbi:DoxX family membrane protein [Pedobacter sp. HMF7647]|uniref:DoxX family membrane protein n=1 Tax=Hufsiella arboris TaxID=2695275 RepID=A0A7K1Y436_9SPHI|nr:BT_3928 family protein [Hufsiella arboris]MXV49347.1 DoxX family membrane protein [Hufsiella arboris]
MKKTVLTISRLLVGFLFIFSGLIKANDPLGFGYKLQEYFEVFHITFLNDAATGIAIFLCALEMILGAALLLGIKPKKVAWGLLLLIVFFTFLTFYSAAFDVVRTCGCFGDAIPLTPWQSFSKDLILLVLIVIIFIYRGLIKPLIHSKKAEQLALLVIVFVSFGVGIYTYNYLPVMDFLPYKVNANLLKEMEIPKDAAPDEFQTTYTLKNKKTSETKKMTDKEYLKTEIWKDDNWEIVGQPETVLLKKGFEPKIRDLKITDSQGTDYTHELLENPYYNLVIVAYDLNHTDAEAVRKMNALAINAVDGYNIRTVLLTSNSAQSADAFAKENKLVTEIFYADGVPLKSMVRANPGLMLMKNGVVINKWHYHSLPSYNDLESKYFREK